MVDDDVARDPMPWREAVLLRRSRGLELLIGERGGNENIALDAFPS